MDQDSSDEVGSQYLAVSLTMCMVADTAKSQKEEHSEAEEEKEETHLPTIEVRLSNIFLRRPSQFIYIYVRPAARRV
jgi:hypothetical protein